MPKKKLIKAVGYIRRSNLNEESKGSFHRQEAAIRDYAKRSGYEVVEFFRDGGKSGTTSIEERDGLTALFARCKAEGITLLAENADHGPKRATGRRQRGHSSRMSKQSREIMIQ